MSHITLPSNYQENRDIIDELLENVQNTEELSNAIMKLEDYHEDRFKELLSHHIKELQKASDQIDKSIEDAKLAIRNQEEEREKRKLANKSICNMPAVREAVNKLVGNYAHKYEKEITNINQKEIDNKLALLKDKGNIKDTLSMKYAIIITEDKFSLIKGLHLPIEICNIYIQYNIYQHPKIIPKKIIIESINELQNIINKHALPEKYEKLGINRNSLTKIQEYVEKDFLI